jgi:putative addiction module CopG family antidote
MSMPTNLRPLISPAHASVLALQQSLPFSKICDKLLDMNVSLTRELERVVEQRVKSGLYNNASEVVCDALRRAFCQHPELDLEEDTPELAALVRQGMRSRHTTHKKGDIQKILARVRTRMGE